MSRRLPTLAAALLIVGLAPAVALGGRVLARAEERHREDRARLPDRASGGAAGGDGGAREAPAAAEAEKHKAAVKEQRERAVSIRRTRSSLGNPQGDVTFVEFFDYNCGYCKRAMADMLDADEGRSEAARSC